MANVTAMLGFGRKFRGISRLMAWLFAVQMLATSFCLLVPTTHAGMMQQNMQSMQGGMSAPMAMPHCEQSEHTAMPAHQGKNSGCAHCDQPDELMSLSNFDISGDLSLPLLALITSAFDASPIGKTCVSLQTLTGPPDSASLIYQTTQRIRI